MTRVALLLALLVMPVAAQVRGRVADSNGGEALAGVGVTLEGTDFRTRTDSSGKFSLLAVPPGDYILRISTVGYRLLQRNISIRPAEPLEVDVALTPDTLRRVESIEVASGPFDVEESSSPSAKSLEGSEIKNLASVMADDPLRSVQSLPGVTSNDDFNAQFSLRGAEYRRLGVYLDGVLLHEPFHTVQGTEGATGSLTAFQGDAVENMALYSAAWPARFGDRTGGVLDVATRDGSRDHTGIRISVGASGAGALADGPLGSKGSWLAGVRKSYLEYLLSRATDDPSIAFGFWDTQERVTWEPARGHLLSAGLLEGISELDRSSARDRLGINSLMNARYHLTAGNTSWKFTPDERLMLESRVAYLREKSEGSNPNGQSLDAGHYAEWAFTESATWDWRNKAPLEAGVSVRRLRDEGYTNQYFFNPDVVNRIDQFRGASVRTGVWLAQSYTLGRLHLSAGGRWDRDSTDQVSAFSPQVALGLALTSSTHLQAAWAQAVQYPDIQPLYSPLGSTKLLPERAIHYSASLEQRFGERTRLRVEVYQRRDRDLLFRPWFEPRLIDGSIFNPPANASVYNALRGPSRGVEVFLQRRSANRLMGWISYAYGRSRLHDGYSGSEFWADFDQRHTFNAYGGYRIRPTVQLGVKYLFGSGFPVPGYLKDLNGTYYLSDSRNQIRLEPYHRLDVRMNKDWVHGRWKITLYIEVVNLLNNKNRRFDSFNGYNSHTGQAYVGFNELFPILPSAGLALVR